MAQWVSGYPSNFMAKKVLLLIAVVIFILATFGVSFSHVSLVPFGLAFVAGALLL